MRNIVNTFSDNIIRRYDLKGSSHNRKVIVITEAEKTLKQVESNSSVFSLHFDKTLKDVDFKRFEEKLWIENKS